MLQSFSFTPQNLTIQQGDTIKWVWIDGGHTSTSTGVWDSGPRSAEAEFSHTELALCTTSALSAGSHSMTAVYSGDSTFNGSTSPDLTQTVTPAAPPMFSATATSASEVSLSWGAVTGATSYEVERSSLNTPFSPVLSTGGSTANDTNLSAGTTYLYQVRAFAGTVPSAFSAIDPATTIIFTDPALSGGVVRGVHIAQLRIAVNLPTFVHR